MLRYIFKLCSFTQPLLYFSGSHSPTENAPIYFLTVILHKTPSFFLWVPQSHKKCPYIFSNCVPSHNSSFFLWVPQSHKKCSDIFSNCVLSHNRSFISPGPTVPQKMFFKKNISRVKSKRKRALFELYHNFG